MCRLIGKLSFATEDRYDRHIRYEDTRLAVITIQDELNVPESPDRVIKMTAIIRSTLRRHRRSRCYEKIHIIYSDLDNLACTRGSGWIVNLKDYQTEIQTQLLGKDAKTFLWMATYYELYKNGLVLFHPRPSGLSENRVVKRLRKFVIWELIACEFQPIWLTVGSASPITGQIASTGRLD